eukprot:CAMPEP_0195606752 /NCGR_PEP_ID=MMETSP0815-20121206/7851_1 /TAXON_ID=97485 /ORGANISM="Prymnesium parvum, Strain Texoma1" /LENGTH=166 /DNA_ID=CAMNT_0040746511 /DNA_START=437 /DNA_END=935 /DNA_ORIENTATION=+
MSLPQPPSVPHFYLDAPSPEEPPVCLSVWGDARKRHPRVQLVKHLVIALKIGGACARHHVDMKRCITYTFLQQQVARSASRSPPLCKNLSLPHAPPELVVLRIVELVHPLDAASRRDHQVSREDRVELKCDGEATRAGEHELRRADAQRAEALVHANPRGPCHQAH